MKNKLNKQAFTLIELLIVIAIIGILFIVLVSKVDFATDKAKATGVQTTFRSFQMAFDQVARENAGFNMFGYNTGDTKRADFDTALAGYTYTNETTDRGDGKRNSYDAGDKNLNGKQDVNGVDGYTGTTEVWTGRKVYTEKWTEVYTLVKPGTTGLDAKAVFALESAINANLDPYLHISIDAEGKITMANQARDPWKNEYHGVYISNAERDNGADRGAIIIYSNGANGQHGSEHDITNGVVTVTVPGNNIYGKDDYSIVSCYTYTNGYGEVQNMTTGFSNNKDFMAGNATFAPSVPGGNNGGAGNVGGGVVPETPSQPEQTVAGGLYADRECTELIMDWDTLIENNLIEPTVSGNTYGISGTTDLDGVLVFPENSNYNTWNGAAFHGCTKLKGIVIKGNFTSLDNALFFGCSALEFVVIPEGITRIGDTAFQNCVSLREVSMPSSLVEIGRSSFSYCDNLETIDLSHVTTINANAFISSGIKSVSFSNQLTSLGSSAFQQTPIESVVIPASLANLPNAFAGCTNLASVVFEGNTDIADAAFKSCTKLSSVTLHEGMTTIRNSVFERCSSLTTITLPNSIETIGNAAFSFSGLTSINLPNGLTSLGTEAFYYTQITSLVIPHSLTEIAEEAFGLCERLTSVTLHDNLTSIGKQAFLACGFSSITIPDSVTFIGEGAFKQSKLQSILLPESITAISASLFDECRFLSTVVIMGDITSIGNQAFAKTRITTIYLPGTLTSIGEKAFYQATVLDVIEFEGSESQWNNINKGIDWNYDVGSNTSDDTYTVVYNA